MSWREWPKVSPARSGAANTKRYRAILITGANGGMGQLMGMGMRYYTGPTLGAQAAAMTEAEPPSRAGIDRDSSAGVAHVGYELHTEGVKRVYQHFVLGAQTGAPRFYGERW